MRKYLSLDMGAESGRLMSVSMSDTIETDVIYRFDTPITTDSRGRRCWNFPKILQEIRTGLAAASGKGKFESVAVDTWGLDFGLINRAGELVSLPVSHRDHRTEGYLAKAAAKVGLERLHHETGTQLLEINSIFQLMAISDQSPDEFIETHRMLMMPDLILQQLTGKVGSEYTIATTTGLYDVFKNDWNRDLARDLNIPTHILEEVTDAGLSRGFLKTSIATETGIGELRCIATTSHDTAAAVVATPVKSQSSAYISSGTWSLMGLEIDKPITNEISLKERLTNEGGFGRNIRLLRNITGLWLIQEVRRDLRSKGAEFTYSELVTRAENESPWRTLIYVDAPEFIFAGEMIGRIQEFARKTGQPIPETVGQISQCVFVSLALQYARTVQTLGSCAGLTVDEINIVGGGSQNRHLSQLTAEIAGIPVVGGPVEATAIGNALVQAIALGHINNLNEARHLVRESTLERDIFEPIQKFAEDAILEAKARYAGLIEGASD